MNTRKYIGLMAAATLVLSQVSCKIKSSSNLLPSKVPSFEQLMKMADADIASNEMIISYINSEPTGLGFSKIKTLADTGHTTSEVMTCYLYSQGIGTDVNHDKARDYCLRARDDGSTVALMNLGFDYMNGEGVNKDREEALKIFNKLVALDPGRGHFALAHYYTKSDDYRDVYRIREHLQISADAGNAGGMNFLGWCYLNGKYGKSDFPKAAVYFQKAYEKNNLRAGYELARLYDDGRGVPQSDEHYRKLLGELASYGYAKAEFSYAQLFAYPHLPAYDLDTARHYWKKASHGGVADADYMLAVSILKQTDVISTNDIQRAETHLITAAEKNHILAQTYLARQYATGKFFAQNHELAIKWYLQAALNGDEVSYTSLMFYFAGKGYQPEYEPVIKLLEDYSGRGDINAAYELAKLYRTAGGVDRDVTKAESILKRLSKLKYPPAEGALAEIYLGGETGKVDHDLGVFWLTRATKNGFEASGFRLANMMMKGEGIKQNKIAAYYLMHHYADDISMAEKSLNQLADELNDEDIKKAKFYIDNCELAKFDTCGVL